MQLSRKQKHLMDLVGDNLTANGHKVHWLMTSAPVLGASTVRQTISELVDNFQETVIFAKELEEESTRVEEREAHQHAKA